MDDIYFKTLLNENPYLERSQVQKIAQINNKFYKEGALDRLILEFGKMRFPSDEAEVLNQFYCKTLDKEAEIS